MENRTKGWKDIREIRIPTTIKGNKRNEIITIDNIKLIPLRPIPLKTQDEKAMAIGSEETGPLQNKRFVTYEQMYLTRVKTGEVITLSKCPFIIGKERSKVDYQITGNSSISRQHLEISQAGRVYYVKDLNSSNHTFVNGVQIYDSCRLTTGTIVKASNEEFAVLIEKVHKKLGGEYGENA